MSYNTVGIIKNGVKQKLPVVMVAPKVDGPDYVEVVADGVKTHGQLLNELRDAVSGSVGVRAVLKTGSYYAPMIYDDGGTFNFTYATNDSTGKGFIVRYKVGHSNSSITMLSYDGATWSLTNSTSIVPASGTKFTIYYDTATLDLTTRASNCVYDNSNSGLSATEVQGAIDELSVVRMYVETRNVVFENSDSSNKITKPSALSGKTIHAMIFSSHDGGGGIPMREYHADDFRIKWGSSLNMTISCDLVWFYS